MYTSIKELIHNELLIITLFAGALCCVCACGRFVWLPHWYSIQGNIHQSQKYESFIAGTTDYSILKKEILSKQEMLTQKYDSLNFGNKDPQDLSSLLQFFMDKASSVGIRIDKTIPQETSSTDPSLYSLVLELSSEFNQFGKYITLLEKMPHLLEITRVQIISIDNSTITGRLLITCHLQKNAF